MISLEKSPMCTDTGKAIQSHKCLKQSVQAQISGSQENALLETRHDQTLNSASVPTEQTEMRWYAMSATFGREMKAKEFLEKNNVRCFVPLRYQLVKGRSKDKVRKLVPAISNLVFVNATKDNIKILKTKLPYLQYHTCPDGGKNIPITVPCAQMEQFIAACNTYNEKMTFVRPDEIRLTEGTRIRIVGGAFDGIEGTFIRIDKGKQKHVVINVDRIAAIVLAKVNDGYIQVLDNNNVSI